MINPKLVNAACILTIIYISLQFAVIGGMFTLGFLGALFGGF